MPCGSTNSTSLGDVVEAKHEPELPLPPLAAHLLGERRERAGVLDIDLHAGMARLGGAFPARRAAAP